MTATTRPVTLPGSTTLSARAVSRIAARAAQEAGALPGRSGALDSLTGSGSAPEADVVLLGAACEISLTIGLAWPVPLRQRVDQLRDQVSRRVGELSGLTVRRIDIDVVALHPQPTGRSLR